MSSSEDVGTEFLSIAHRLRTENPYVFRDVRTLPLEDNGILAHAGMGEDFRASATMLLGHLIRRQYDPEAALTRHAVNNINRTLLKRLLKGGLGILPDDLIAVNGVGVIVANSEPESDDDDDATESYVLPINHRRTVFGTVKGVRYGRLHIYSGSIETIQGIDLPEDTPIEADDCTGLGLLLSNVVFSDSGGWGKVYASYGEAYIPLAESRLVIQKCFPLDDLVSRPYI